jgi:cyclase
MVKGVKFANHRDTGNPSTSVRIYSAQDADELVFLDIDASLKSRSNLINVIREAAKECFMPLAVGGGVRTIEDVQELLLAGADKVVVTTLAVTNPMMVNAISQKFGAQCVIGGIDYRMDGPDAFVWTHCGTKRTNLEPVQHSMKLVELGVGEIFLNSIDRDGTMKGYDIEMAEKVAEAVQVPVIVAGGAGNFMHLVELLRDSSVSAAACASLFHFGDNNPIRARSYLKNLNVPMRMLK